MATSLDFERSGVHRFAQSTPLLEELVAYVKETSSNGRLRSKEPGVRSKLAQAFVELEVSKYIGFRTISLQEHGQVPNREASASKVFGTELLQRVANIGMEILGLYGQIKRGSTSAVLQGRFEFLYLDSVFVTIGARSSEINRNVIATRGLGLPR